MKAAVFSAYGSPEVLQVQEIDAPAPREHEVLVRIHATAVNSGDVRLRKADPFAVRFMLGLFRPKIRVLGVVFSGVVEAVGKSVTRFHAGDEVFGMTDMKFGTYAQYRCMPQDGTLALKPQSLSHAEAAVIPFGATTALHFLRQAQVQPGHKVLVYGASGAVGTAAVQLARHMGAEVTAVCSTANVALLRDLGAHHVIDYSREDFLAGDAQYDVIFEAVNKAPVAGCLHKLSQGGRLILGAAGMAEMMGSMFRRKGNGKKLLMGLAKFTAADIAFLGTLVAQGALKPVIDRTYALEEIAAAHAYVEAGHKKGNVAITVA